MKIPEKYREPLYKVGEYAAKLGLKAWVVGGAVRDFYLKRDTQDVDLAFNGNQESVAGFCIKQWGGEKHRFSRFLTFRVELASGVKLDLVRTRKETYPYPGSLPQVEPSSLMKEDLFRRDFTTNAWCFSILPDSFGELYDPFGAQKDIVKGLVRILHKKSFLDDPTRMYRAVRFAGRFGWRLAPKTERLLRKAVQEEYPLLVSRERFSHEFLKILEEPRVKDIFALLDRYDMLKFAWPGLTWNPALLQTDSVVERVGILACQLNDSGENFVRSLRLPASFTHEIVGAWKVGQEKLCPLEPLSVTKKRILQAVHARLPEGALNPCVIGGRELKDMGLMGRHISSVLTRVRKAQWDGTVKNKSDALKLLEK